MQRIASLAACRELGGLAVCRPGICAWKKSPSCSRQPVEHHQQWAGVCVRPARPFTGDHRAQGRRFCRRRFSFAGQRHRLYGSQPGTGGPAGRSDGQPDISVVGIPDPLTWIRCKVIMYLIDLYFELDLNSVEFDRGVKQALVHVSNTMSRGRYHELRGILSHEMVEYVEKRCRSLTNAQRQQLAVAMDDIIFVLPEDVSVVFDQYDTKTHLTYVGHTHLRVVWTGGQVCMTYIGRKYCFIIMRFWLLSTHEGPDDPEGTKIFKVTSSEDGSPQKKLATAVYEFHRELTRGASPDWTVTTVWHWHWKLAE